MHAEIGRVAGASVRGCRRTSLALQGGSHFSLTRPVRGRNNVVKSGGRHGIQRLRVFQGLQADHRRPGDPRSARDIVLPRRPHGKADPRARRALCRQSRSVAADGLWNSLRVAATMLAVNKITGMQFFEVTEAEAADQAAAKEIMISRKAGPDFIVDV